MEANMMDGWRDTLHPRSGFYPSARNADVLVVWNRKMMEEQRMGILWATKFPRAETDPLRDAIADVAG